MVDKHDNPAKKANVPAGVIFCNMVKNVDAITSEPAQFVAVAYEVPIPLTFWGIVQIVAMEQYRYQERRTQQIR